MNRTAKSTTALLGTLFAAAPLNAQPPVAEDPNRSLRVENDRINDISTLSWWGRTGDTYFMQVTPHLNADRNYVEQIHRGGNGVIQHGFATNADALFFRIVYSGVPVSNPDFADFDSDGLNNLTELRLGLDPFNGGDADFSEVAGVVQSAWNAIDDTWRQRFVNDPSATFYDPTYGSPELPLASGQTEFSLNVPAP